MTATIRVGIVGLGANCRLRHVPGLRACDSVEIVGVCNRRRESTHAARSEFEIPKAYDRWEDLVADPTIDAVVIGTWPYLHCPITLAALDAGKHVLCEARMSMDASEARTMLAASERHPDLVAQVVPSPFGLRAHSLVKDMIRDGRLGQLREVIVLGTNAALSDPHSPLHWRQSAGLSGVNMLALGILHETLLRWLPADPTAVFADAAIFTSERTDPASGAVRRVETPDSVHVLAQFPEGLRGIYHLSGVLHHGPTMQIHLYGSKGTLRYELVPEDRLLAGRADENGLHEVDIPEDRAGSWRVERDFIDAIRGEKCVHLTDFATGVRYMEFTEAVARSVRTARVVSLPLAD